MLKKKDNFAVVSSVLIALNTKLYTLNSKL